jgi:HicB family
METTPYVDALLADLTALAELGDEAVADAARRLGQSLRTSAGMRLLDLLGAAALEISAQLPEGHVEVRLAGQQPTLVYVEHEVEPIAAAGTDDGLTARITLRLPETLKASVEAAAAREGVSVNTWIVRALGRSTSAPTSTVRRSGRRLTGYGES